MPRSKSPKPRKPGPKPHAPKVGGFDPATLKGTAIKGHPNIPRGIRPMRIPGKGSGK
jgi:hypothetical protein